jgi:hypothetical protein
MNAVRLITPLLGLALFTAAAPAETTLKPRFQEGATFRTKETSQTRQSLKLGGQNQETAAETAIISQSKVGRRNAEGDLTIETTYTEIVAEISLPAGKKVTYNSKTGEAKSDDPNFEIILEKLKGMNGLTFTAVVDKDNKLKSISGLPADAGASPEEVKTAMQNNLDRYPAMPVNPGDTWEREIIVPLGQGQLFKLQRTFKYIGPDVRSTVTGTTRLEKITAATESIEYQIGPDSAIPGKVTKSDLKAKTGETTVLFDPAKGRTVEASDKLHVTGAIALSIMGIDLPGELDLTMETKSEELP